MSLKRANPVEEQKPKRFFFTSFSVLMATSSVEKPEKIETEQRAEKPVAKKAQTPPRGKFLRLISKPSFFL